MRLRLTFVIIATMAVIAAITAARSLASCDLESGQGCVLSKPDRGEIYHAAFPEFGGPENRVSAQRIRSFERLARKRIAWAYFSNNWFDGGISFPTKNTKRVIRAGRVPFIRMMARTGWSSPPDPNYSMESLADGSWDPELIRWCDKAAQIQSPLLVEFGTEVNGDWFPWNGRWNGGGETTGYGDPSQPDGPESFIDAYRRIITTCRARGADNITWFYHADVGSSPNVSWNKTWSYYPGDSYIDWIGLSDYGALRSGGWWASFRSRMDRALPPLINHIGRDKPFAVLEFGAAEQFKDRGAKPRWIRRAFSDLLSRRWPEIRAVAWWDEAWRNGDGSLSDLHIDSSRRSLRAYRRAVRSPKLTGRARFESR